MHFVQSPNCKVAGFKETSVKTLSLRLNEFNSFLQLKQISRIPSVTYSHLSAFVADYKTPSIHVKKARIWTLRQFFHYLKLKGYIKENIATNLPYPKIEKTVPQFLTIDEYNRILHHCSSQAKNTFGLRNLIIIMVLGMLGLRTGSLVAMNIQDVDIVSILHGRALQHH